MKKTLVAIIVTVTITVIFSNKIVIDPITKIRPDPSVDGLLDDNTKKDDHANVLLPPPEATIVNGTKKAISKRDRFILGAVTQYGVTTKYDGAYKKLAYPNGDVDITTGVCTDVIIRAFRSVEIDLQQDIHRDMKRYFRKYPKKWNLKRPDSNIDHRRVPNMVVYFQRQGYKIPLAKQADLSNYLPGDLVVWRIRNELTHIGIVSDQKVPATSRYYIIHNPFQGVEISDWLVEFEIINHFRIF